MLEKRNGGGLGRWLQKHEIERFWKRGQHQRVGNALRAVSGGAYELVKTFVMALGVAVGDGVVPKQ